VLRDFENEWAYEHQFLTSEVHVPRVYGDLFRAASEQKYNIDIIPTGADFGRYRIIFAPYQLMMDEQLAAKMKAFVEGGGTLIMSAHGGVKDRDNAMTDQTVPIMGLKDLFGIEVDSWQTYQPPSREKNSLRFEDGAEIPVHVFAERLKVAGAQVIATWGRDFLRGLPAVSENRRGRGRAVYYGSFFNLDAARHLLSRYAGQQNLRPLFADFPKEIEVTRRTKGEKNFYFILNHGDQSVTLNVGSGYYDLLEDRTSPAGITLPPFGYKVLRRTP